jgi:predicted HD superfamily hydrolase involved in NAD metabolism
MIADIKSHLKAIMSAKRYEHTLGVAKSAKKLAEIYKVDPAKAELAALLHDCAKHRTIEEMRGMISKEAELTEEEYNLPEILHGFAGAIYARNVFRVEEVDILNAIKYHTIGRKNMSMLEKVVYTADVIEAGRKQPGVEKVRDLAYNGDIDCAIMLETEDKIRYLLTTGRVIHTNTLEMRNSILLKSGQRCRLY